MHRKDNEINALCLALRFIRRRLRNSERVIFPPPGVHSPAPFMERGLGEMSTLGYSIEIARNLLSMRMAKAEVAKATGLSIEEVDRLALSYV